MRIILLESGRKNSRTGKLSISEAAQWREKVMWKKKLLPFEFGSTKACMLSESTAWWNGKEGTGTPSNTGNKALSMLSLLTRIQKEEKQTNKNRQA